MFKSYIECQALMCSKISGSDMGYPKSGTNKPRCAARALGDLIPGSYEVSLAEEHVATDHKTGVQILYLVPNEL